MKMFDAKGIIGTIITLAIWPLRFESDQLLIYIGGLTQIPISKSRILFRLTTLNKGGPAHEGPGKTPSAGWGIQST